MRDAFDLKNKSTETEAYYGKVPDRHDERTHPEIKVLGMILPPRSSLTVKIGSNNSLLLTAKHS